MTAVLESQVQISSVPELMSNGMSNSCLKQAVGFHLNTIRYPGIDTCISITIAYEVGIVGLHLFRNTMESTLEDAVEQLRRESANCSGNILHVLIAGNIENWMSKAFFHNYSLSNKTSKSIKSLLMTKFGIEGSEIITTTQIQNNVEVTKQSGTLSASNYPLD
ncbi:hypothetical protein M9194_11050 [Vibrio sp. S4M6]|uniref:hypothetical protein n=1 Tax=Vibrio sinus TaxID=2946865 RepID=UPI00202A337E|nr:hypothetical protein [Vibrio sinus]MCL9781961.1 hypothetical protein [Vibrio sinus]